MFALFEEAGKFQTGRVLAEAESSAQIELDSGKRVKVKAANVLLKFEQPAPAELMREALQSRVNALATDFINRDDPVQRDAIQANRQKALAELDRTGREIRALQTRVSDIQEEARRAGVPPGWLR